MKITENSHFCAKLKHCQRVKHKVLTLRLVKHVERSNFPMILYRTTNNLLGRGHGKDLTQLTPLQIMGQEREIHWWGDSLRWCGEHTLIYSEGSPVAVGGGVEAAHYMGRINKIGLHRGGHSPILPNSHSPLPYGKSCMSGILRNFSNNHVWGYFWFWHL